MNVYDFDRTIFRVDSSEAFCRYCLRLMPRQFLSSPMTKLSAVLRYAAGGKGADATPMKEQLFSFLSVVPDPEGLVLSFWDEKFSLMQPWYLAQSRQDDLIISASPEFLLRPAAERLGVSLIATPMDPYSGRILGRNCHDEEKLRRFRAEYPDSDIDCFYSDSLSDAPLASIAAHAILVKGDRLLPWPQ